MGLSPRIAQYFNSLTPALALAILSLTAFAGDRFASVTGLDQCDALFELREKPSFAMESASCYIEFLGSGETDTYLRKAAYENAFEALARIQLKASTYLQNETVRMGLDLAATVKSEFASSSLGPYWLAVFTGFKCRLLDSGPGVPHCLKNERERIIQLLGSAIKLDPSLHGFGPHRYLGVILRETDGPFGSQKYLSEESLKIAVDQAPNFSANYIEYARTLIALKRSGDAAVYLHFLIDSDCLTMDPNHSLECTEDQRLARTLLQ